MRSKALPGWAHTLCTAAAALVFLLAYELVVYRVPVTEIFLPVSSWSDEVIYSKQYQHAQQPEFYLGIRQKAAYAAQAAAYQMGIRKEFPLEIPEMPQAEQCLQSIPDGIQSLQEDWIWISQQMKLERQGAAVQATPTEAAK